MMKLSKIFYSLILVIVLINPLAVQAKAKTYEIDDLNDFLQFSAETTYDLYTKDLTVNLNTDLDLAGTDFSGIAYFQGTFKGNNHTIKNFEYDLEKSYLGLFRYNAAKGIIQDLKVEGNLYPKGSKKYIGGIVGSNAGQIINCSFQGRVQGEDYLGGIAGINEQTGEIKSCVTKGYLQGVHFVGGIAGSNYGVISDCTNYLKVNTIINDSVKLESFNPTQTLLNVNLKDGLDQSTNILVQTDIGGIAGFSKGEITTCTNKGLIGFVHVGYNVGGICGRQSGLIDQCINEGLVFGRKDVGGIVGQMEPYLLIQYREDALQRLDREFTNLQNSLNKLGNDVQSSLDNTSSKLEIINQQLSESRNKLTELIKKWNDDPTSVDSALIQETIEYIDQRLNNSSTQFTDLTNAAKDTGKTVNDDLTKVNENLKQISSALTQAKLDASNLSSQKITDISSYANAKRSLGKIIDCQNMVKIDGDIAVGGIAGNMAIEYDVDKEEDIAIEGKTSLNARKQAKAVIINCLNEGLIVTKKGQAGGISGREDLGAIISCENYGDIFSEKADQLGGIVGVSLTVVKDSYSLSKLTGNDYLGGIVGKGYDLENNYAMVTIDSSKEFLGSIAGEVKGKLKNNYFVNDSIAGIDGISYAKEAIPVSYQEFIKLPKMKDKFKSITLTFEQIDQSRTVIEVPYNSTFAKEDIPQLKDDQGTLVKWSDFKLDNITRSQVIKAESTSWITALASLEKQGVNPELLVDGQFNLNASCTVFNEDQQDLVAYQGNKVLKLVRIEIKNGASENYQAHLLVDQDNILVYEVQGNQKKLIKSKTLGKYVIFQAKDQGVYLIAQKPETSIYPYVIAIVLGLIILVFIRTKRKIKHAKKEKDPTKYQGSCPH